MNIGFYGHSNCAYQSPDSFIDMLATSLGASVINVGVRQGSEERILFELKKSKALDLAIIFHSEPQYIFLPDCDRDISVHLLSNQRAEYLFSDWNNNFTKIHHKKFVDKFKNPDTLLETMKFFKNYLYHPELQSNRFYGSLIQIDQYLTSKNIPCVHVVTKNLLPTWFKFSGKTDYEIMKIVTENANNKGEWFVNGVTKQGNILIFEKLKVLIQEVLI
jgi:hypothetical protein